MTIYLGEGGAHWVR